jgi:hypothetical protein
MAAIRSKIADECFFSDLFLTLHPGCEQTNKTHSSFELHHQQIGMRTRGMSRLSRTSDGSVHHKPLQYARRSTRDRWDSNRLPSTLARIRLTTATSSKHPFAIRPQFGSAAHVTLQKHRATSNAAARDVSIVAYCSNVMLRNAVFSVHACSDFGTNGHLCYNSAGKVDPFCETSMFAFVR